MKRKIKRVAGIVMAAAMVASSATSIFALEGGKIGGSIAAGDLKIDVSIPTGTLAIKPYAAPQIFAQGLIENKSTATTSKYDVTLVGYTAVGVSKSDDDIKFVASLTANGTDKEVAAKIYVGAAAAAKTDPASTSGDDVKTWATGLSGITQAIDTASDENYTNSESEYTKIASPSKVTLTEANVVADVAVYGTMNVDGTWTAGDTITVTPVWKIAPVVS